MGGAKGGGRHIGSVEIEMELQREAGTNLEKNLNGFSSILSLIHWVIFIQNSITVYYLVKSFPIVIGFS